MGGVKVKDPYLKKAYFHAAVAHQQATRLTNVTTFTGAGWKGG